MWHFQEAVSGGVQGGLVRSWSSRAYVHSFIHYSLIQCLLSPMWSLAFCPAGGTGLNPEGVGATEEHKAERGSTSHCWSQSFTPRNPSAPLGLHPGGGGLFCHCPGPRAALQRPGASVPTEVSPGKAAQQLRLHVSQPIRLSLSHCVGPHNLEGGLALPG